MAKAIQSKSKHKKAEMLPQQANKDVQKRVRKNKRKLTEANEQLKREIEARKQAELALQESRDNFSTLAENVHCGILLTAGDGVIVYTNQKYAEITGYTVSELMKFRPRELIHPPVLEKATQKYYKISGGKDVPVRYKARLVRKDGETIPIGVAESKTIWQGQPAVLAIIWDISDRKKTEELLRKAYGELDRRVQERTIELMQASEEIKNENKELLNNKLELQSANQELVDINKALSVLARNIDKSKQEAEMTIAKTITSKITTIVEGLRKENNLDSLQSGLEILAAQVQTLTEDLMNGLNLMVSLTPTEMQHATMIKNGLTSQDIANMLNISLHTAKTHRRNIRKKLNVRNSNTNLTSYLRSIM